MAEPPPFERIRKTVSFAAVSVFATSFAALLVLSATPYWTPENEWLPVLDQVWRWSGLTAIVLGSIPPLRRFLRYLSGWFSEERL